MINYDANYVQTNTIGNAWREVMQLCIVNGEDSVVKKGSYEGQIRKQLPYVTIRMTNLRADKLLAPIVPPSIEPPTTDEEIEKYFANYLMDDRLLPNEQYRYSTWIKPQLPHIINLLKVSGGDTNQASITVGDTEATKLEDPPCLKYVGFKTKRKHLQATVLFRSWDLVAALPQNLGGLQLLKEYVLCMAELNIDDGDLIATSDGLHIYEQYFKIANALNVDKIYVRPEILAEKEEFLKTLKLQG
jgi:thymidylate synthase